MKYPCNSGLVELWPRVDHWNRIIWKRFDLWPSAKQGHGV